MDNSEKELREMMKDLEEVAARVSAPSSPPPVRALEDDEKDDEEEVTGTFTQWAVAGNDRFGPVGRSIDKLAAGIYEPFAIPGLWGVERLQVISDDIYQLPDMQTNLVLNEVETFWKSEAKYKKHKLLYRRGILLFGPPGGGKTATLKLLMNELVKRDGIVVIVSNVSLALQVIKAIRRIEPNRNLITVFEDIDEIIDYNGESAVLSLLDGEANIDKVLNLATTNYPAKLGARIINRPSRFDRRVNVGMPSDAARSVYITKVTNNTLNAKTLKQWIVDTEGFSIAHIKELAVAVYCLDQDYDETIIRLQEMANTIKIEDEFKRPAPGFGSTGNKRGRTLLGGSR